MDISVVTVTKNGGSLLEKTITSISQQSCTSFEYCIIDNCSTDSTLKIVESYRDSIDFFLQEPDKGIYDAMNKSISKVKGQYILFLNSGDVFYDEDTLANLLNIAEDNNQISLFYGDTILCDDLGNCNLWKARHIADLWKTALTCHQSILCRKDLLEKRNFDIKFKVAADSEWMMYLYYKLKEEFFYIAQPISIYLKGGVSEKRRLRVIFERWVAARKYCPDKPINKH